MLAPSQRGPVGSWAVWERVSNDLLWPTCPKGWSRKRLHFPRAHRVSTARPFEDAEPLKALGAGLGGGSWRVDPRLKKRSECGAGPVGNLSERERLGCAVPSQFWW